MSSIDLVDALRLYPAGLARVLAAVLAAVSTPAAGQMLGERSGVVPDRSGSQNAAQVQGMGKGQVLSVAGVFTPVSTQSFIEVPGLAMLRVMNGSAAWGDYNNDGFPDLLVATSLGATYATRLYRNNGDHTFSIQTETGLPDMAYGSVAWGDYDNDGDLDILITGSVGGAQYASKVFRNEANGTFVERPGIALLGVHNGTGQWGDYDSDGDLDILLCGNTGLPGNITRLYRNLGGEAFVAQSGTAFAGVDVGDARWGDYDGDGDLDILLVGAGSSTNMAKVYRNNGNSSFSDQTGGALVGVGYSSADWGDYDNDGDLDIVLAGVTGAGVDSPAITKVYRNIGGGTFVDQTNIVLTGVYSSNVAWGDVDNDGDMDLLVAGVYYSNGYQRVCTVYRNDGSNQFVTATNTGITPGGGQSAAWVDYDQDGDLDVYQGWTSLYRNVMCWSNGTPAAPQAVLGVSDGSSVRLSWYSGSDRETPSAGLRYSIRIGSQPGGVDRLSPMADSTSGRRLLSTSGPISGTNWTIRGLPLGSYYWSVQTVDSGGVGSPFCVEQTLVHSDRPVLLNHPQSQRVLAGMSPSLSAIAGGTVPLHYLWMHGESALDGATGFVCRVVNAGVSDAGEYRVLVSNLFGVATSQTAVLDIVPVAVARAGDDVVGEVGRSLTLDGSASLNATTYEWRVVSVPVGSTSELNAVEGAIASFVPDTEGLYEFMLAVNDSDVSAATDTVSVGVGPWVRFVVVTDYGSPTPPAGTCLLSRNRYVTNWVQSVCYVGATQGVCRGWTMTGHEPSTGTSNEFAMALTNDALLTWLWGEDYWFSAAAGPGGDVVASNGWYADGSRAVAMAVPSNGYYWVTWTGAVTTAQNPLTQTMDRARSVTAVFATWFAEQASIVLQPVIYSDATWGDYDSDGDLDILLTGTATNATIARVYRNNGNHTFTAQAGIVLQGVSYGDVAWGDYDSDGWLDILLTGLADGAVTSKVYRGNGSGFSNQAGIVLPGIANGSAVWADYDNDGRLDILLSGNSQTRIYRNNGDNTFTEQAGLGLPGLTQASAAWGDYDGDGYLDLALSGHNGSAPVTKVYRNSGTNTLVEQPAIALAAAMAGSVAWGDYDGDGDLDLLVMGRSGVGVTSPTLAKLYRNDGAGAFAEVSGLTLTGGYWSDAAWGDYDNDGDLDLLLIGRYYDGSYRKFAKVYRNDGGDTFVEQTGLALPGVYYGGAAWGDYDNDGDLDILLSGGDTPGVAKVYRNVGSAPNDLPMAPSGLSSIATAGCVRLSWTGGADGTTPAAALGYNLRLGVAPGGSTRLAPQADPASGWRRVAAPGPIQGTNWSMRAAGLEDGIYYWSVQTLDSALAGSAFAAEGSFSVPDDLDGDGLPYADELRLGTDPSKRDSDGDGLGDGAELAAGTDPRSTNSVLRITGVDVSGRGVRIYWCGGTGVVQCLERAGDLAGGGAWTPVFTNPPPTPVSTSIVDEAEPESMRFYRLRVQP